MNADKMEKALEAVLLFHSGSQWTDDKQLRWQKWSEELLGPPVYTDGHWARQFGSRPDHWEVTTRVLCDMVREALKEEA